MEKRVVLIGGVFSGLLVILFIARFIFGGDEDNWICTDLGWVKHGNPTSAMPTSECKK